MTFLPKVDDDGSRSPVTMSPIPQLRLDIPDPQARQVAWALDYARQKYAGSDE